MTDVIRVDPVSPDRAALKPAADRLRAGALVAFPTETVTAWALRPNGSGRGAPRVQFKGRPPHDPLIVHISRIEGSDQLVTAIPDAARALAAQFWPGPLTLVLGRATAVPDEVTAGLATVAVRIPSHPVARALLDLAGVPVAAPSANLFSRPSPTRASHVLEDLKDRIDVLVDGGATNVGIESTVLDLTGDAPTILRPGAITLEALRKVLPQTVIASPGGEALRHRCLRLECSTSTTRHECR